MATKDRKKLQHIHSSIADKQPTPQSLEVGEIAVNNSADKEFLSLKNSNDKVVRFSSDSTIIDWIENKEVVPYKGYVRGEVGPSATSGDTPSADEHGSYGITNDDLLNNKSNIIVKINQVAAKKTVKYDKINAAKDLYEKEINPSENTPTGKTDGAGFFIDMSRYAMIGANPSFSSITVTDKSDLSGNTTIANGDETGTRSGHTLTIKTTDVSATDTNWTENITNKTEKITLRDTTIGTEKLYVSGTTIETYNGAVTITNNNNKVETIGGINTINNEDNYIVNTSGDTHIITTRNTAIHSNNRLGISANKELLVSSEDNIIITANDEICETAGNKVSFYGVNQTNIGLNCDDNDVSTITKINGDTIKERANTVDTMVTSAYTSATTATTVIGTANTSATTATLSGDTLVVNEATSISAKTPSTTISGTNFTLNETNTTINSCGKVEITTDSYSLKQCSSSGGSAEFEFCNGYTVKSNAISLQQCETAGTINITSQTQNINGGNLTANESGNTAINTVGTTNIKSTGNTNVETNGTNNKVTIQASGSGGDVEVFAKDTLNETSETVNITSTNNTNISAKDFCVKGSTSASIGAPTTNIGKACDNSTATTINISGTTINEGGTTNNNNFTTINNTATTINNKANFNITGSTYISGNTVVSGDVTIGDDLTIPIPCDSITSTTVNNALCEILNRGAVTIEKNTSPTDPQLATIYTIKQNGAVINTIEVAKDQFLQNAEVVKNTSGEWVIRLTWWIYDPDSGTHTTATTDIAASELVKDLTAANPSDNGTALNHNVSVNAWYDSTSGDMKFSAETTQNMHVGNMYVTGTTSASTVSGTNVNGGTISGTTFKGVSISGANITASTAIRANNVSADTISATTFYGKMSKSLTWAAGAFTADTTGYNGSADKVITVPTAISHLSTRGKLTITHNGLSDTYDPASDKSMTLPHSALTINFGVATGQTNTSYNTSAGKTITIPTATSHLSKAALTIDYNADVRSKSDTSYDTTAAATVSIPGSLDHLSNYDGTNININHPTKINGNVSVTGTITASGAIYSSDRNLKENIFDIDNNELEKAGLVSYKTYNFKGEDNKMYGIIAQDLQEVGLGELVYSREDGTLAVDYTSFMILELARLRRDNETLLNRMAWLEGRIDELEGKKKD